MLIPEGYYRLSAKAFVTKDNKVLLTQWKNGIRDLPGGGVDHGEPLQNALQREIAEEMGVEMKTIEKKPLLCVVGEREDGKPAAYIVYKVDLSAVGFTPSDECVVCDFYSYAETETMKLSQLTKKVLDQYFV